MAEQTIAAPAWALSRRLAEAQTNPKTYSQEELDSLVVGMVGTSKALLVAASSGCDIGLVDIRDIEEP